MIDGYDRHNFRSGTHTDIFSRVLMERCWVRGDGIALMNDSHIDVLL